jgi:hypothetical protein
VQFLVLAESVPSRRESMQIHSRTRCGKISCRCHGIKHLVERGSTDDLLVRLAVFRAIKHRTTRGKDHINHVTLTH